MKVKKIVITISLAILLLSFINIASAAPPSITITNPTNNDNITVNQDIEISADITDDGTIDTVLANITLPNASIDQITLSLASGDKYNGTYSIPSFNGDYTIIIIANDTVGDASTAQVNFTGVFDSPLNISDIRLWLDASDNTTLFTDDDCSTQVTAAEQEIRCWTDKSENNADVTNVSGKGVPLYATNIFNGHSVVNFSKSDQDTLRHELSSQYVSNFTIFVVIQSKDTSPATYDAFFSNGEPADSTHFQIDYIDTEDAFRYGASTKYNFETFDTEIKLYSVTHNGTNVFLYTDGTQANTGTTTEGTTFEHYRINQNRNGNQHHNSYIGEIILYNRTLNSCEREMTNVYLGNKYGRDFFGVDEDYGHGAPHNNDINGISEKPSNCSTTVEFTTAQSNILTISNPSDLDLNDSLTVGHDNQGINESTEAPGSYRRLTQEWRVDIDNTPGNITITFDLTDNSSLLDAETFVILTDTNGDFSDATIQNYTGTKNGNTIVFSQVTLTDANYFTLGFIDDMPPNVTNIYPAGQTFNTSTIIDINATVIDGNAVHTVIAQIDYPNATSINITLTHDANNVYTNTFTTPKNIGLFNITIIANDTWNNINNTENSTFVTSFSTPSNLWGLQLWLDAADNTTLYTDASCTTTVSSHDQVVLCWEDKSDGAYNATVVSGKYGPKYKLNADERINDLTVLRFNKSNQTVYETGFDIRATTTEDITSFSVYRPRSADVTDQGQGLWGNDDGSWDRFFYSMFAYSAGLGTDGVDDGLISLGGASSGLAINGSGLVDTIFLLTAIYDGNVSGGTNTGPTDASKIYFDGNLETNFTDESHATSAQTQLYLGWDGDNGHFDGDYAETIVYDRVLDDCEVELVNNYLGEKYGRDFSNIDNYYDLSAPHTNDIKGIGTPNSSCNPAASITSAQSDIVTISNPTDAQEGDLVTIGHNDAGITLANEAPTGYKRVNQEWRADVDNDPGNITVEFDLTDTASLLKMDNFVILTDTDSNFDDATVQNYTGTKSGNIITFTNVSFTHADYFTLGFNDTTPPNVTNLYPTGQAVNVSDFIYINATVTDNIQVNTVLAQVNYPRGISNNYTLTHSGAGVYTYTLKVPKDIGLFNITIIANDSSSNTNNTENTTFIGNFVSPESLWGLRLWLDATDNTTLYTDEACTNQVTAHNQEVYCWEDKADGDHNATNVSGKPVARYMSDSNELINGLTTLRFNKTNESIYQTTYDIRANTTEDLTSFNIYKARTNTTTDSGQALWGNHNGGWDRLLFTMSVQAGFLGTDGVDDGLAGVSGSEYGIPINGTGVIGQLSLLTAIYDGQMTGGVNSGPVNGSKAYLNGKNVVNYTDETNATDAQDQLFIGTDGNSAGYSDNDVSEMIFYDRVLTACEIETINNYLGNKYGLDFNNKDNYFAFTATHTYDINGIGIAPSSCYVPIEVTSAQSDFVTISNASNADNGDLLTIGHDNGTIATSTQAPSDYKRITQVWKVDIDGTPGNITITFDVSTNTEVLNAQAHSLLTDTDGDFSNANIQTNTAITDGNIITFSNVNLNHADYFTLGFVETAPNVTNVYPSGQIFDIDAQIQINATVTDDIAVHTVIAQINYPNATATNITLVDAGSNVYTNNFTVPKTIGLFNITIIANDTWGNINNTENATFISRFVNPNSLWGIRLWLDASDNTTLYIDETCTTQVTTHNQEVYCWEDKSDGSYNATNVTGKDVARYMLNQDNRINGRTTLRFNKTNETAYKTDYDIRANTTEDLTSFNVYVQRSNDSSDSGQALWGNHNGNWDRLLTSLAVANVGLGTDGIDDGFIAKGGAGGGEAINGSGIQDTLFLLTAVYDGNVTNGTNSGTVNGSKAYLDGKLIVNFTDISNATNANESLHIGQDAADQIFFDGDISELIFYDRILTSCEIETINNYLGQKYGKDFNSIDTNYAFTATHGYDINGIGIPQSNCYSPTEKLHAISDFLNITNASIMQSADILTIGHDDAGMEFSDEAPTDYKKLAQEWKVDVDNTPGNITLTFDITNKTQLLDADTLTLLIDGDGNFTNTTVQNYTASIAGNKITFSSVNLSHAEYFALGFLDANPNVTGLYPSGQTFDIDTQIQINATVTDGSEVETVIAQIDYPNATSINITLVDAGSNVYTNNFTVPKTIGLFNITIIANDTLGNINNTQATNFISRFVDPNSLWGVRLWLDASDNTTLYTDEACTTQVATHNQEVYCWEDKSDGIYNATNVTGKDVARYMLNQDNRINGRTTLRFNKTNETTYKTSYDIRANNTKDITSFTVYVQRSNDSSDSGQALWGNHNGNWDRLLSSLAVANVGLGTDGIDDGFIAKGGAGGGEAINGSGVVDTLFLLTAVYDGNFTNGENSGPINGSKAYLDGKLIVNFTDISNATNANESLHIGQDAADQIFYDGDISELIFYDRILNTCEIETINNYLGHKYGKDFNSIDTNYAFTATHGYDINGIGIPQSNCYSSTEKLHAISDFLNITNASIMQDADILTIGHDNAGMEFSNEAPTNYKKLAQEWKVDVDNTPGNITLTFDVTNKTQLLDVDNLVLLIDGDGNFTNATVQNYTATIAGNKITFSNVNLSHAEYFALGFNDTTPPAVTNITPNQTIEDAFSIIEIIANVTDIIEVHTVLANITYPNSTIIQLPLTLQSGNIYTVNYTVPRLAGVYTITIIANDTSRNINSTENNTFTATLDIHPGGISNNLDLWLDAKDAATLFQDSCGGTAAADGDVISCWQDKSGNNRHVTSSSSNRPTLQTAGNEIINSNPTLDFDGSNDYLDDSDGENYINGLTGFSTFVIVDSTVAGADRYIFNSENAASDAESPWGLRFDNAGALSGADDTLKTGINTGSPTLYEGNEDDIVDAEPLIASVHWTSGQAPTLFVDARSIAVHPTTTKSGSLTAADYVRIGHEGGHSYWSGGISEIVHYGTRLNNTAQRKIESYLAIKYGITLHSTINYVDSDNTTIYNSTGTHTGFTNDIAGVGRDDASDLNQTQSQSVNSDSIVKIHNASDTQNKEFLIWGNNNNEATQINTNIPLTYEGRLNRTWRIAHKGDIGLVSIDFNITGLSIDGTQTEDFALLINTTTNFSQTTIITATNFSENIVSFDNINFTHNDYFTLITEQDDTPPQVTAISPDGQTRNITENITIQATVTDANSQVDTVLANITYPNATITQIELFWQGNDIYNSTFTLPSNTGTYTITIIANDTLNNINNTESTTFIVEDPRTPTIIFVSPTPNENQVLAQTHAIINITSNSYENNRHYTFLNINSTLLLWLRMDDTNSTGHPTDLSGYGHNATLQSGALINSSGNYGDAAHLDGNNDYIDIGTMTLDFTKGLSICSWVYWDSFDENWPRIVDLGQGEADDNILLARRSTSSDLSFEVYIGGTGGGLVTATSVFSTSIWQHVCVTQNSSGNVRMYVDSINVQNGTTSVPAVLTRNQNYIGRSNWASDDYFDGSVDELLIFNRTLTNQEISSIYNASVTQFSNNFTNLGEGNHTFKGHTVSENGQKNETELQTITIDTTGPDITGLLPTQSTEYNISDIIEIATNVTDIYANVSYVLANVSYPNATISQLTPANTLENKYNTTFTIPSLLGTYNITFIANDSLNNINNTVTTTFIATEPNPPNVTPDSIVTPRIGQSVTISANITDDFVVDTGLINITYPNGTINQLTLTNPSGNIYNVSFTVPLLEGTYTILFIANDSSGNTNSTESITFNPTAIYPGNVSDQIQLWLRADDGVTTSSSNVTNWQDQYYKNTFTTYGDPSLSNQTINYNEYIEFRSQEDYLDGDSIIGFTEVFLVVKPSNNGPALTTTNSYPSSTKEYWLRIISNEAYIGDSDAHYIRTTVDVPTNFTIYNNEMAAGSSPTESRIAINGENQTVAGLSSDPIDPFSASPSIGRGTDPTNNLTYNGEIAEIIVYNTSLTANERVRVNSYLAIKYGITLESINYKDSENNTIYNTTGSHSSYIYDIAGIGRDDRSQLNQTQSKSINSDAIITVSNSSSLNDREFLIWGNNNASLSEIDTNIPQTYQARLNRTWRIDKTSQVGLVTIEFNLTGISITGTQIDDFKLLIDSNTNFTTTETQITPTNYSNNILTFDNVNFTENAYFTILTADDQTSPQVTGLIPMQSSIYNTSNTIEIGANITDSYSNISYVLANITYPNGTINQIQLTFQENTKYNNSFTIPQLTGTYTLTIIANDTLNNINDTESITFTVRDTTPVNISFISSTPNNLEIINQNNYFINISSASSSLSDHYTFTNVNNTLIMFMRMDDTNASGHPTDIGPYSNNGSLAGEAVINSTGKFGNAVHFDGSGDYINLPASSTLIPNQNKWTISTWFNAKSINSGPYSNRIVTIRNDNTLSAISLTLGHTNNIQLFYRNSTGSGITRNITTITTNTWYHYAVTYNGTTINIYVNGTLNETITDTITPISSHIARIAADPTAADNYFHGAIDEIIILNRSITDEEIASLYNATANQYENNFTNLQDGNHTFKGYAVSTNAQKNETEVRIVTIDTTGPQVTGILPTQGTTYNISNTIEFAANATDTLSDVSYMLANITYPNGSINQIQLSLQTEPKYNNSFTIPELAGTYTLRIIANDTLNNINSTESITFTVQDTREPQIYFVDSTPADSSLINKNNAVINITSNSFENHDHYTFLNYNDTLLLWIRMDDLNASGHPTDISGYNNNGTIEGNPTINSSGKFGDAGHFDGVNDFINVSDDQTLKLGTSDFTISAWFNLKSYESYDQQIICKRVSGSGDYEIQIEDTNVIKAYFSGGGSFTTVETSYNVTLGQWYHTLITKRDGVVYLYVNGTLEDQANFTGDVSSTAPLLIGQDPAQTSEYFNGSIDEVLIFNRSFTQDEILAIYNATANQYLRNFTTLTDGSHTFKGHAVSTNGKRNETELRTITIDTTPPQVTNLNVSPNATYDLTDTINISVQVTDNIGLHSVSANVSIPNGSWMQTTLINSFGSTYNNTYTLQSVIGTYNVTILTNDTATNTNNTQADSFELINDAPSPSAVTINDGNDFTLTSATNTTIIGTATLTDQNGYADISSAQGYFFMTTTGANAQDNRTNHYTTSCTDNSDGSGSVISYNCTFNITHFATPTDASANQSATNWTFLIAPLDAQNAQENGTDIIDINTLLSFNITPSIISFGSLDLGENTTATNQQINITNLGNVPIDLLLSGTNMSCSSGVVPVTFLEYKDNPFIYGIGTDLLETGVELNLNISKGSHVDNTPLRTTYYGLGIPSVAVGGSCNGSIIITGQADPNSD